MDKPVFIIEAPKVSNKTEASVYDFLHELIIAFESHYYYELTQYKQSDGE